MSDTHSLAPTNPLQTRRVRQVASTWRSTRPQAASFFDSVAPSATRLHQRAFGRETQEEPSEQVRRWADSNGPEDTAAAAGPLQVAHQQAQQNPSRNKLGNMQAHSLSQHRNGSRRFKRKNSQLSNHRQLARQWIYLEVKDACMLSALWLFAFLRFMYRIFMFLSATGKLKLIVGCMLVWFYPAFVESLLKWCAVALLGHTVFGLIALQWWDKSKETQPIFRALGYEFSVRKPEDSMSAIENLKMVMTLVQSLASDMFKSANKEGNQVGQATNHGQTPDRGRHSTAVAAHVRNSMSIARIGMKCQYMVPINGVYLTPTYTNGITPSDSRMSFCSYTFMQKAGVLFSSHNLQGVVPEALKYRVLLFRIQIRQTYLELFDELIKDLIALFKDLTPATKNTQTIVRWRIANKEMLKDLTRRVRKVLYNRTDREQLGHAWWHDHDYSSMLNMKDIAELTTFIKISLHKLITKRRPKVQSELNGMNEMLIEMLSKDRITNFPPRGRTARGKEALQPQQMEEAQSLAESSIHAGQVMNGNAKYSGVAGRLMVPGAVIVKVGEGWLLQATIVKVDSGWR